MNTPWFAASLLMGAPGIEPDAPASQRSPLEATFSAFAGTSWQPFRRLNLLGSTRCYPAHGHTKDSGPTSAVCPRSSAEALQAKKETTRSDAPCSPSRYSPRSAGPPAPRPPDSRPPGAPRRSSPACSASTTATTTPTKATEPSTTYATTPRAHGRVIGAKGRGRITGRLSGAACRWTTASNRRTAASSCVTAPRTHGPRGCSSSLPLVQCAATTATRAAGSRLGLTRRGCAGWTDRSTA